MTFWDHLEELRHVLLRCISVIALFAILAFVFKDEVFAIIFAPKSPNFLPCLFGSSPDIRLINTELTRQFIIHMMTSFHVGLIVAAPYIIYELYRFHLPWPLRKRAALFHAARRLCLCHVYGRHTFSVISLFSPSLFVSLPTIKWKNRWKTSSRWKVTSTHSCSFLLLWDSFLKFPSSHGYWDDSAFSIESKCYNIVVMPSSSSWSLPPSSPPLPMLLHSPSYRHPCTFSTR